MKTISKILIAYDLYNDYRRSEELPIEFRNAIRLIEYKETAQLILVGCGIEEYLTKSYSKFGSNAIATRKEFCNKLEKRLTTVADKLAELGYQVECRFIRTYPRNEQIAQLSEDCSVDLVVQHVNSTDSQRSRLTVENSWQLAQICHRPVLLVKDKDWQERPVLTAVVDPMRNYHSVVASESKALNLAIQAKDLLRGDLHIVHAHSSSSWPFSQSGSIKNKRKKALVEMLAPYEIKEESVHLVDKTPLYALLEHKQELKPDLLIMDTVCRSRFTEAIIGNPTRRVLDYLQTDLLIIKQNSEAKIVHTQQLPIASSIFRKAVHAKKKLIAGLLFLIGLPFLIGVLST